MFKKVKRLAQTEKAMVATLDIERIGMVIKQDMEVMVQYKRGKLVDSTEVYILHHKGGKGLDTLTETKVFGQRFSKKV
jgi:hypothetical protein